MRWAFLVETDLVAGSLRTCISRVFLSFMQQLCLQPLYKLYMYVSMYDMLYMKQR